VESVDLLVDGAATGAAVTIVHWAYSVVVGVATRSGDVTNVPPVAAVNQPENLKPRGSASAVCTGVISHRECRFGTAALGVEDHRVAHRSRSTTAAANDDDDDCRIHGERL